MKYGPVYIDNLLSEYWEGNTSLDQEKELGAYFSQENLIDPKHEDISNYFIGLYHQKKTILPDTYNKDYWLSEAAVVPKESLVLSMRKWAIAASFLLLVGTSGYFIGQSINQDSTSTVATADEAAEEAEKAILILAEYFKKGQDASADIKHLQTIGNTLN